MKNWEVEDTFTWNRRHIQKGTELSISGVPGRFRFVKYVRTSKAEWIEVVGGKKGAFRSFRPDRIKTVHRINKTRENAKILDR